MKTSLFSRIVRKLWYIVASIIILAALVVSTTRLMTPVLNDHRADFEKFASKLLQMPVMIHDVDVEWRGYTPQITLHGVDLLDPDTKKPRVLLHELRIDFSIWRSILERSVYIKNLTVSGVDLTVTQQTTGELQIGNITSLNIKDQSTGSSVETDKTLAWTFSQPRLSIENFNIRYNSPDKPQRFVTLSELTLRNDGGHHVIDGKAMLHQLLPIKVHLHLGWDGDVRKLKQANGHTYIYLEGLSLPQWFGQMQWAGLQVKKGVASMKLWARWNNGQWEKIQSVFEVYDLQLYSNTEKKSENIDRISANLGWERNGNTQTLAADQIFIDFPHHLWPATNFSIKVSTDANDKLAVNAMQFNYLNLNDALRILNLIHSELPADQWEELHALNPQGEIQNFQATVPTPITDVKDLVVTSQFSGLTLNPFKQSPGITNFKGSIKWDKNSGELKLANAKSAVNANQVFSKSINFTQLLADITVARKSDGSWNVQGKDITVANPDLDAKTTFTLMVPAEAAPATTPLLAATASTVATTASSPVIDLTSDIILHNAASISNYMPDKVADPDLTKWIKQAFYKGTGTSKLIVQGPVDDFPFETNTTGKFLETTQVSNMDFSFAPNWPRITNLNGEVVFAGRAMNVKVVSGKIGDVPLQNVNATIPYLGKDKPQVVLVDGTIVGDLSQSLAFIHSSPLEKTLGKDLKQLNLKGPMQLKLGLTVPLKTPEDTKVTGDVTMTNASLTLPAWKVVINNLNGAFQFTDTGITAKNIQGQFFGAPTTLNLQTLMNAKSPSGQIQADIATNISIKTIESWTGMSLSQVLQGTSPFTMRVLLAPHNDKTPASAPGTQITVLSDLKGISFNLPDPYAKKAADTKPFQLVINSNESDVLQAKIDYAKQISAVLNLKSANQSMDLIGGQITIGGKSASAQTAPGILVTGSMKTLNIDVWKKYFESFNDIAKNKLPTVKAAANKTDLREKLKLLRGLDLNANSVEGFGQKLSQVRLQVDNQTEALEVKITSPDIVGQVTVPYDLKNKAVNGKFEHIYINSLATSKNKVSIDPRELPAMNFEVNEIRNGDISIGHTSISVEPDAEGLAIRQLQVQVPSYTLNAVGNWTYANSKSSTRIQGEIVSTNFTDAIKSMGVKTPTFLCKKGDVKFSLNWPNAPFQFEVGTLNGDVKFDMGEGLIVVSDATNSKIGLGRILNIFSLSTLQRRLTLDFSDVTQKGYSFDYMKADFNLRNGSAVTNNLRFDGPVARIDVKGRVGLAAKDVDIALGVKPYVTGSIPAIAAFAGGPIIGVAALVVDKVVSKGVSQAITYRYNVRGPWSNPITTPASKEQTPTATSQTNSQFPMDNHRGGSGR